MYILLYILIITEFEAFNKHTGSNLNESNTQAREETASHESRGYAKDKYHKDGEEKDIKRIEPTQSYLNDIQSPSNSNSTDQSPSNSNNTDQNMSNSNNTDQNTQNSNNTDQNTQNSNNTDQNTQNSNNTDQNTQNSNNTDHKSTSHEKNDGSQKYSFEDVIRIIKESNQRFESKFDELTSNFSQLTSNFSQLTSNFSDFRTDMNTQINDISKKIDINYVIQNGDYSKNSSIDSTGIIEIRPKSDDGNIYASGNLIKYGTLLFFSTCRHVIKTNYNLIRTIRLIQLYKGPVLKPEGPIYIFNIPNISYDYALIKINQTAIKDLKYAFSRAADISETPAVLSEIVRGICYRDVNLVYIEGQVVETDPDRPNIYQTNCGGTHGFSGAGYFDKIGKLKVIHRGSGHFLGEEEFSSTDYSEKFFNKANKPFIDSINKSYKACSNMNHTDEVSVKECFSNISSTINIHARNPRMMVLDASQFYNLITNKTHNTLIVYQNNSLEIVKKRYKLIQNSDNNQTNTSKTAA